jgi:iron complex transport system substrate-binding protein
MIRVLGLAALLVAAPVAARDVQDMLGRPVTVPDRPARVVSLAPSMTEIVYALGAGDRLVGVTDQCDFPGDVTTKPRVGGIYSPNFEAILTLGPDLVLATSEGNREEDVRALARFRIPVYVVRPLDVPTVLESIGRVARLLGREAEGTRVVDAMRLRIDAVARAVARAPRPRVLYLLWGSPLIVPGRDTLITDLIRRAGGDSVSASEPLAYPRFSMEEALARRPSVIVIARHGLASVDDQLKEWTHLTLLPAVREGRVGGIDGDLVHRPGPRIVDGLVDLARLLHPERMP